MQSEKVNLVTEKQNNDGSLLLFPTDDANCGCQKVSKPKIETIISLNNNYTITKVTKIKFINRKTTRRPEIALQVGSPGWFGYQSSSTSSFVCVLFAQSRG